eukprot:12942241-Alexandrium_andersonii.AAC.1
MSSLGACSSSSERLQQFCMFRHLYVRGCPQCNPQSAHGPSVLQAASIRNPHEYRAQSLRAFGA